MNENESQSRPDEPSPYAVCGECGNPHQEHVGPLADCPGRRGSLFRQATLEDLDRLGIPRPKPAPGPHLVVDLVTTEHRGDHAADVRVALEPRPWEALAELVARAGLTAPVDRLEVRLVRAES